MEAGGQRTPEIMFVEGSARRRAKLQRLPFAIGRRVDKDLVLTESRCSRDHARIERDDDGFWLLDEGSKLGTFVNGEQIQRHLLRPNDVVEFGVRGGAYMVFAPEGDNESEQFLSRVSGWSLSDGSNEFETLALFLEAARKLNSSSVLEDVLRTLLDASLRLTHAERGYVFLRDASGAFRCAAGRSARGDVLADDDTVSRSCLEEAASGCEFVVNDWEDADKLAGRESVADFGIASVICIPLRSVALAGGARGQDVQGVLYLDSRMISGRLSAVSHDVLRTIANGAAALLENAALVQARDSARRYEQELEIASSIQQRLLAVRLPQMPFAAVRARSIPCRHVGGDFFEVACASDGALAFAVGDVSGKGIAAALLASVLQGMTHSHLAYGTALPELARVLHQFIAEREIEERYATMVLGKLGPDGALELVNCGHPAPMLVGTGGVREIAGTNLPVGLVAGATFEGTHLRLEAGERLVLVTDGVFEAQDTAGEYFGHERLRRAVGEGVDAVFERLQAFCGDAALQDDCTGLEVSRIPGTRSKP
jgi:sigma-B regulation protein RsbU (phosphoserine phosphatase)